MKFNSTILFLYALLILTGGVFGYVKAQSLASLIMGTASSVLLLICAFASYRHSILGYFLGIALSSLLTLFFLYRYIGTQKFMPAGLMAIVSFAVVLICTSKKARKEAKQ